MHQGIPLMPTFCWVEQDAKVNIFPFLDILNLAYACALQEQMNDGIAGPDADFLPKDIRTPFIEYLFVHLAKVLMCLLAQHPDRATFFCTMKLRTKYI